MKFVGVVVLLAWIKVALSQECTDVCPTDGAGWNSNLRVVESSPTSVVVGWDQDTPSSLYRVRYRPQDTQSVERSTTNITELSYNISALMPDTTYEVLVCRAMPQNSMDDCGNCILCVTTPPPPLGPPDPPPNLRVRAEGPESFSISWGGTVGPNITAFFTLCVDSATGVAAYNVSQFGNDNTPVTFTVFGFTPDTTYNCSVAAASSLGVGPFSPVVQATTEPRTTGPAILLMMFNSRVDFSQITETTVDVEQTYEDDRAVLISDASRALGIDYHYFREELYFATDNKTIVRVNVTLGTDSSENPTIALSQANGNPEEVLLSGLPGDSLGSVAVDWVYDELYWIEYNESGSRVRRAVLSNGSLVGPFCVAQFSERVRHIIVDPVHGYFNWNDQSGLHRAPISSVRVNNVDCPSEILDTETLITGNIILFTFESDQIYLFQERDCGSDFDYTISVANLNGEGLEDFVPTKGATFPSIASYTQRVIVPDLDPEFKDMPVIRVTTALQCPASPIANFIAPDILPNLVRTLRDTQQPLPAPTFSVSNVRVAPSDTSVLVSWSAPVFTGSLFSPSAYDDWMYIVEYRPLGGGQWSTMQTSALSLTITGLDPGVLYEFDVVAQGLNGAAGETRLESPLVFTTTTQANIDLVVATQTGVIRTDFAGQNTQCVDQDSQGSIGVTFDSYSDTTYWAIDGIQGQGQIVSHGGSRDPTTLFSPVSNPFSLRLDWVTRRLFWVQDGTALGSNAIMYASVDGSGAAEVFQPSSSTVSIESTAMDALNGLLFWVSDTTINRKTLSGVEYPTPCHIASTAPTALTVDPERRLLYWLSNTVNNGPLSINQLEYSTTDCMPTIQARELTGTGISFSSSATMTYASDTLFIASQTSGDIFAIPSDYSSVPVNRTFAVSSLQLSSVCIPALPVNIQDIAVTSTNVQPLPSDLTVGLRGLMVVTPSQASSPIGVGSTSDTVMISWNPVLPVLSVSPLLYVVNYQLNQGPMQQEAVIMGTSLVLTNQQPSTSVTTSVTACSLWQCGQPSAESMFESLPDIPGVVRNVRTYAYRPLVGESVLSALVLWDPPINSVVTRYHIFVQQEGVDVPNVYQPPGNDNYHTLLQRAPRDFSVTYFIAVNTNYTIEIIAENPSGNGTASPQTPFNVPGPNYPRQVLVLEPSGVRVVGNETGIVTPPTSPFIQPSRPFAVDTITREVFFASLNNADSYTIFRNSLQEGGMDDPLKLLDPGMELLDLAYDWIAREVYYAVRTSTSNLEFHKVFVLDRNINMLLFPNLVHTIPSSVSLQLTIDPMSGFLYWQQTDSSSVQLHSLNLRQSDATSSTLLSTTTSRRKRQSDSLASINLSPVLTLDPVSGGLLVAATNGDIYSCNVTSDLCEIVVNGSDLAADPSTIALPPTHIAVDGGHIYWSNEGQAGVYAVERGSPSSLIPISNDTVSGLFGLSPESQPLVSQLCLSPPFEDQMMRPMVTVTDFTNTTVSIDWPESVLPQECADVVFSFPPVLYTINVALPNKNPFAFIQVGSTFTTEFTIEGLDPFTLHSLTIRAANLYSMRRNMNDNQQGGDEDVITLEGVPEAPMNITFRVFGTSSVQLFWDAGKLRGPTENQVFYVRSASGQETAFATNITSVNSTNGIDPGIAQLVQVFTSNGVFNSTAAGVFIPFWELAPAPRVPDISNTSLNMSIELRIPSHNDITAVAVQVCEAPQTSAIGDSCDCPNTTNDTDFQGRGGVSDVFDFSVDGLTAFTLHCVQSLGRYRVELEGTEPEIMGGMGTVIMTDEGVPDAPSNVQVVDSELQWTEPTPRSFDGVRTYLITATAVLEGQNSTLEVVNSPVNLQTNDELGLMVNVLYTIRVQATNDIGTGPPSQNDPEFRRAPAGFVLDAPAIAGIAVSATVLIALCLCFVLFCVWFVRLGRPKEQEIRSLSYMYGPDHELSNLRSAFRQTQSQNPHYTWCREDYVCTDEDLDLLSKFPRHNLKLENFIDRGEFGEVYQGTAIDILGVDTGPTPVAVKTLRKGAGIEDQRKFLSEASLMSNFNHPNIVKVLGVCLDNDPVYIIMELMPAGDLLKFLRDAKRDHGPTLLTLTEQIQVALDVAHGCRYLEQQHFIHRDIAARNCLVSSKGADRVVKIGDFGLARDLYSSDYYQVEGQRKLPVRWMAPEALLQGKFAVESDIWSFGVLLWEIMSLGNQPYPGRINQEVLQFVTGGGRLDKPEKCPSKLYHLMQNCWKRYASDRPHFEQIVTILTNFLDRIKRPDSVYHSDTDSDSGDENLPKRQSSTKTPTRSPSFKSGFMNLARSGSIKLRNSFRRHGSIHKREENTISQLPVSSSENLIAREDENSFRERGPF